MNNLQLEQLKKAVKETIMAAIELNLDGSKEVQIDISIKTYYIIFEYYSKGKQNGILSDFAEIVHCKKQFPFLYEMDKLKRLNRYIKEAK